MIYHSSFYSALWLVPDMKGKDSRKSSKTHKLALQLGVPFIIFIGFVITVLIFGTLYWVSDNSDSKEISQENILQLLHVESTNFFGNVAKYINIADTSIVDMGVLKEDGKEVFDYIVNSGAPVIALRFLDNSGDEIYTSIKSGVNLDSGNFLSSNKYIAITESQSTPYTIYTDGGVRKILPTAQMVSSVEDGSRKFMGTTVAIFDLRQLLNNIKELSKLTHSNIFLVDDNYFVAFSSLEGDIQRDFKELFTSDTEDFSYEYMGENNMLLSGTLLSLPQTNLSVIVESEISASFFDDIKNVLAVVISIVILLIALMVYEIVVFNKGLVVPLRKFKDAINKINTGDYSVRIKIKSKNELRSIALTLNDVAAIAEGKTAKEIEHLKETIEKQNIDAQMLIEQSEESEKSGEKAKKLDETKSMFVSVAAHQMRTPLAAVKWAIKMVMDGDVGPVNPEQKAYLFKGYEANGRLINLINDLLNVDKIESDKAVYQFEPQQIEDIIDSVIVEVTPIADEKGVTIQFEHGSKPYQKINSDAGKMRDALQNLIDNAIKYTIGGGVVTIRMSVEDSNLKISVQDTGIGIPKEEHEKVFMKFFRAKNAVRKETDGSGLGLFIVKEIISKHGGEVSFKSEEGKGTTFTIIIPISN